LKYSSPYVTEHPDIIPASASWPDRYEIVDSLVTIAHLNNPKFYSPTLFSRSTVPTALNSVEPILYHAHPAISNLTCAVLHPRESSCLKVFVDFIGGEWGRIGKLTALIYSIVGLATYRSIQRQYFRLGLI
jgi:hypothetical protein